MLQVLLTGAAIISGVAIGLGLAHRLDLDLVLDRDRSTSAVDVARGLAAPAVASLATAVAYRSRGRLVLPTGADRRHRLRRSTARCGSPTVAGPTAATAAAAVVVGLIARLLADPDAAPALVLVGARRCPRCCPVWRSSGR